MSLSVDLNADLGEGAGHDDELLALVSSANISCGLHAGNPLMMRASIRAARDRGVAVGAHPSFDDRENFGRREISLGAEEIYRLVFRQVGDFHKTADSLGVRPQHVKPHGALYNMAARDAEIAEAIARALRAIDPELILFAPGSSALSRAAESNALRIAREVFADRNYMPDGALVSRDRPEALLHDANEAGDRIVRMLREGKVRAIDGSDVEVSAETICVHGDTPDAVRFALAVRSHLLQAGIKIAMEPLPHRAGG